MPKLIPAVLSTVVGVCALASTVGAQSSATYVRDDQKGRFLNFEVGPVRSVLLDVAGDRLLVLNQPGNRLVIFDRLTLERRAEIPIGLGAASMALRPNSDQVWIVDRVYSAVEVVDLARRAIVRSIRVDAEPHGIAFAADGSRAWVSCSGADTVVAIDAATYAVAQSISIPARAPRGIAFHRGRVWVASFLSGNGTSACGTLADPNAAVDVAATDAAGLVALPDLDLFPIQPGHGGAPDSLDTARARERAGTILFDVVGRPGTGEVWIPGTEALNAKHRGEASFVDGQVVSNRIAIFDVDSNAPARIVDLDALAPSGVGCAQPTSLAFDPTRPRAYVCAYGSDLVAVLDLGANGSITWAGRIAIPPKQEYPRGSGPRSCVVDPAGANLYVFNRNDHAVVRVPLAALPNTPNFAVTSAIPTAIGFDASSDELLLGRHLFTDARNSASNTSSCASCHVDGHTDWTVWDLSQYLEPEGTPLQETLLALDVKGPLVTQSTRRQEESGPYHWRGEKRSLNDFNASFVSLLDRTDANGNKVDVGGDFQYLRHYINRIAIPANPLQARDRSLRPDEARGLDLFTRRPVLGSLTCNSCHALPLGSSGEIAANGVAGVPTSLDVPGLRRVADREEVEQKVGGAFGDRPRSGAGLSHAGVFARLEDVFARTPNGTGDTHAFALSREEAASIAAFLRAFDTGLAPATAWQVTAHAGNWAVARDGDVAFLLDQARAGNCDVVAFRAAPADAQPAVFARAAAYDAQRGTFLLAGGPVAETSLDALLAEAAKDRPVTFLGVPLGMGLTVGIDRDADGILDLDELRLGTDPDEDDSDGDRFADGYEVQYGADPLVPQATIGDQTPPSLVGPVRVIYATSNTVKVEFDTSEYCRVHVGLDGGVPLQRIPLGQKGDERHFAVLGGLEPGREYVLDLALRDSAQNLHTDSTTRIRTAPRVQVLPTVAADIRLQVAGFPPILFASVDVHSGGAPVGAGYHVHGSVYRTELGSLLPVLVTADVEAPTTVVGTAILRVPLGAQAAKQGRLYFVLTDVVPPAGGPPYVRAESSEVFDSIVY
jgi:YVTN family beta-propeller protein